MGRLRGIIWTIPFVLLMVLVPPTATPSPTPTPPPGGAPCWMAESDQAGADFGGSVSSAGDVNGDGYDDVLVGAYNYDNGQVDEGGAFVYYGSPAGPSAVPDWTAEGDQAGAWFARRAGPAGDVNGDGYDDIIVGVNLYDNGQVNEGRAVVYFGSAAGLSMVPDWTMEGNQSWAYFGRTVATAGDVNGDGYDDILVGARLFDNGQYDEGKAYLYYGSPSGPSLAPDWTAEGGQASAHFSEALGPAGDVNGDGYDDVIVSALYYDNGEADEGRVYVYLGSAAGLSPEADWVVEGNQVGAHLGTLVATAGDVDGDGYDDVLIGAPYYDSGLTDQGAAFIYRGSAAGLATSPDWVVVGDQAGAYFGCAGGPAGDVNGDGFADVVVAAYWYDNGQTDEGKAYLYYGSAVGASTIPAWSEEGQQDNAWYGNDARTAGDVNADGYADFLVGARYYDNGQTDEGRAYLYCGAGAPPPPPPPPPTGTVAIDIKPGSCPNPVQRSDRGTLPVAVLGTAAFDVTTLDPASVRLQGVAPLRYSYEDVSRPMVDPPDVCNCTTEGPDGYTDLVLHFDVQAILATLPGWASVDVVELAPVGSSWLGFQYTVFLPLVIKTPPGEQYVLTLTATSWPGALWTGQDCIIVLRSAIDAGVSNTVR